MDMLDEKLPRRPLTAKAERYTKNKVLLSQSRNRRPPLNSVHVAKAKRNRIDGALQENIVTLLCTNSEAVPTIIAAVDTSLFESSVYRTIADRAISYFKKYGVAPGEAHLPDLFEKELVSKASKARYYYDAMQEIRELAKTINRQYVLDNLQEFVNQQYLRRAIFNGAEGAQTGDVQGTKAKLLKDLERVGEPQGQGLLGLDTAVHTYGEFSEMEFPPVDNALHPVLQHPGITQINGFRNHFKTGLAHYMAVGTAAGVDVFDWACKRHYKVLLLDAELPPTKIQKLLEGVCIDLGVRLKTVRKNLRVLSKSEGLLQTPINLADPAQTDELAEFFTQFDIVFLDSITTLTSGVNLREGVGWETIDSLCMHCRDKGTSIVRLQHMGKDPAAGSRGASEQEDHVDVVIQVKQKTPNTFHGNPVIGITYTKKGRGQDPKDFKPMDLELSTGKDGHIKVDPDFKRRGTREDMSPEIMDLMRQGEWKNVNMTTFAEGYGVHKSTVSRAAKKARQKLDEQEEEELLIT